MSATQYHVLESCNKCTGVNDVEMVDTIVGDICEARTSCTVCGFTDYWAYGWFESGSKMESKCEKYTFEAPRL